MSWLKSAVNKAVEVGGRNNLTRTVRSYADTVVQTAGNAVTEGAKIITDRIVNFQFYIYNCHFEFFFCFLIERWCQKKKICRERGILTILDKRRRDWKKYQYRVEE